MRGSAVTFGAASGVETHETTDGVAWDAFVESSSDSSGYHLWGWRLVIERAFGHRAFYIAARRDGATVGVLPLILFRSPLFGRFMVSLPFVNYGGVVAETADVSRALLSHSVRLAHAHRCAHLEFRHRARSFADLPTLQHKVAMILPLAASPDAMWAALDRKVRNQIRKAEKSGLSVTHGGAELLGGFYRVFAHNMRDLGTPVYGIEFFREIVKQFPTRVRLVLVSLSDRVVAAAVTYRYRDALEVPWASSLRSYRSLSPNNLLYWSIIRSAVTDGCRELDFGRSTPDAGTYQFKLQWGAVPHPLYWEYQLVTRDAIPNQSPANPRFSAAIALWKRLPVSIATRLGPHIVRSIP
jgi:FemAB-related protein (PEP-CTERM system-associated)